ncbi:MAG: hypothetical protein ACREOU_16165 [Candidatus Eiseniibacteriota bacterium]
MTAARVLGAGLVAAVTNVVVGASLAHAVGVERLQAALRDHGLRVIGQPSDLVPHIVVRMLIGISVTLLFVCLVPRFGARVRTALVTAGFAWAFMAAYTAWGHEHIGLFTRDLALTFAGCGAVELTLTALVGGWVASGRGFWK